MIVRRGFTLLELMVALVIASVVALLAYGTARAGMDASDRLEHHRTTIEGQALLRALLLDALRHPTEGGGLAMDDTLFVLEDAVGSNGLPQDAVQFFTRGITPPLGATDTWSVTLVSGPDGLRMHAVPQEGSRATPIDALLATARGLNVRVLARTADSVWTDRWDVVGRLPAAVALEFFDARGTRLAAPLIVHGALEGVQ
jgi:prepilin-type N-terminal cleavage/methylation domain-containing protein